MFQLDVDNCRINNFFIRLDRYREFHCEKQDPLSWSYYLLLSFHFLSFVVIIACVVLFEVMLDRFGLVSLAVSPTPVD